MAEYFTFKNKEQLQLKMRFYLLHLWVLFINLSR